MAADAPECSLGEASLELLRSGQGSLVAGELAPAVAELERANELSGGGCHEVLMSLAAARLELERYETAGEAALQAVRVATSMDQEAAARVLRGRILLAWYDARTAAGDEAPSELLAEAEHLFRQALLREAGLFEGTRFLLAHSLELQGESAEARSEYLSYLHSHPDGTYADRAGERLSEIYGPDPNPGEPKVVTEDITPPVKIRAPQPAYPKKARRKHIEGVVILQAVIDRTGKVRDIKLLKGLYPLIDQSAIEAVRQWAFEPARIKYTGEPVAIYYTLTINFQLMR